MNATFRLRIVECRNAGEPVKVANRLILRPNGKLVVNGTIVVGVPPRLTAREAAEDLAAYLALNNIYIVSWGQRTNIPVNIVNMEVLLGAVLKKERRV